MNQINLYKIEAGAQKILVYCAPAFIVKVSY